MEPRLDITVCLECRNACWPEQECLHAILPYKPPKPSGGVVLVNDCGCPLRRDRETRPDLQQPVSYRFGGCGHAQMHYRSYPVLEIPNFPRQRIIKLKRVIDIVLDNSTPAQFSKQKKVVIKQKVQGTEKKCDGCREWFWGFGTFCGVCMAKYPSYTPNGVTFDK